MERSKQTKVRLTIPPPALAYQGPPQVGYGNTEAVLSPLETLFPAVSYLAGSPDRSAEERCRLGDRLFLSPRIMNEEGGAGAGLVGEGVVGDIGRSWVKRRATEETVGKVHWDRWKNLDRIPLTGLAIHPHQCLWQTSPIHLYTLCSRHHQSIGILSVADITNPPRYSVGRHHQSISILSAKQTLRQLQTALWVVLSQRKHCCLSRGGSLLGGVNLVGEKKRGRHLDEWSQSLASDKEVPKHLFTPPPPPYLVSLLRILCARAYVQEQMINTCTCVCCLAHATT